MQIAVISCRSRDVLFLMQIDAILHFSRDDHSRKCQYLARTNREMTSTNDNSASQRQIMQTKGCSSDGSNGLNVVGMDFFDSRYFTVNKVLLRLMGLWPYESALKKMTTRILVTIFAALSVIPQFICLSSSGSNFHKAIQALATLLYFIGLWLKYILYVISESRNKILFRNIAENWKLLETDEERNILLKYSETGRFLSIGYVAYMAAALVLFVTLPAIPPVLDKYLPLANGSRPKIFVLDGEFLVDKLENYRTIYLFESCASAMSACLLTPIDSTYALTVEQCVGLFSVVKLRLKLATKHAKQGKSVDYKTKDVPYEKFVKATELHKKVLDFAQVLEKTYSISFLTMMAFNVVLLIIGSVVVLMNLDRPMELFRYGLIYVGLLIHMFYLNWPGQKMIDSSGGVFYDTYNNEWYDCSLRSQRIVNFIMLRSVEPLVLTCGGYYIMNLENYGALMKTSFSYITVFAQFR